MLILGIETSCDETSAAVVRDGNVILSNVIATSAKSFEGTGGVIPENAARKQLESIGPVIEKSLSESGASLHDIDLIAVTKGPGLTGSLLVGTTTARALASMTDTDIVGVHHTLGHMFSTHVIDECNEPPVIDYPVLTLSVSGGHTELWIRTAPLTGTLLGSTRDDAAGEAYDKGAALLGLPYPGGPSISSCAQSGNPDAISFPLPLRNEDGFDFSFSGLKTSLRTAVQGNDTISTSDVCASYQRAINAHLLHRTRKAFECHEDIREIHVVGGVSANDDLMNMIRDAFPGTTIRRPHTLSLCTDNAAMICSAGYAEYERNGSRPFFTNPRAKLTEIVGG